MTSFDDLEQQISADSAIRKKEIIELEQALGLAQSVRPSVERMTEVGPRVFSGVYDNGDDWLPSKAVMRTYYVMLYSHWEGFVKQSLRSYYRNLGCVRVEDADQYPKLWIKVAKNALSSYINKSLSEEAVRKKGLPAFPPGLFSDAKIGLTEPQIDELVDVKSNLNFSQFVNVMELCGISVPESLLSNRASIDRIVFIRNGVAHGDSAEKFRNLPGALASDLPDCSHVVKGMFREVTELILDKASVTYRLD